MSGDHSLGHQQRATTHLKSIDGRTTLAAVLEHDDAARDRISSTFAANPRMAVVFRCVQRGVTMQREIGEVLADRSLGGTTQPRVSEALARLDKLGFIRRTPNGTGYVVQDFWFEYGLEAVLRRTLRKYGVKKVG